jgi:hypothetical protein
LIISPNRKEEPVYKIPKTVTVESEILLDAIAALYATGDVFASLNGETDSPLDDFFLTKGVELRNAVFDKSPPHDDSWVTHPVDVEVEARGHELAAEALEASFDLAERVRCYRDSARRMRLKGTVDVPFCEEVGATA